MKRNLKGAQRLKQIGRKAGKIARAVAMSTPQGRAVKAVGNVLRKNKRKMRRMVEQAGITPSENLGELAVQTTAVRQKQIENIVEDNEQYPEIQDEETASEYWEEEQENGNEEYTDEFDGENDYFTADALSTIVGTAKGLVEKVKQGRLKKGKKFLGKSAEQWKQSKGKGVNLNVTGSGLELSGITNEGATDVLSTAVGSAKTEAIQDNLKRYLPILVVVVVVFIFGRKFFK